jgi:predicted  nucleic acid-binding Zn-ribbon protein
VLVAARAAEQDIATEQRKAESDVDQVRDRAARDQQRLDSGAISTPRELESLRHEIETLAKRQSDLEDVVLETMERREAEQQRIADLTERAAAAETELADLGRALDAARAELTSERDKLASERAAATEGLPADLLALYEKLRASSNGVGAAALKQRRCEGCRLELDISELNAIRAKPADAVVRCDNCRRILVRTAESGL